MELIALQELTITTSCFPFAHGRLCLGSIFMGRR